MPYDASSQWCSLFETRICRLTDISTYQYISHLQRYHLIIPKPETIAVRSTDMTSKSHLRIDSENSNFRLQVAVYTTATAMYPKLVTKYQETPWRYTVQSPKTKRCGSYREDYNQQ